MSRSRLALVPLAALTGISCFGRLPTDAPDWRDQLEPKSPCYEVNLLDGLDEEGPEEIGGLFDCLNHHGHLTSMQPMRDGFDDWTREDETGVELSKMVNHMGDVDVDVFAVAGVALDMVQAEDRPVEEFLDVALELSYGQPAHEVRHPSFPLTSQANLRNGVLTPLAPVVPEVCDALLDDDLDALVEAGDYLGSDDAKDAIYTLDSLARSPNSQVRGVTDDLLAHTGELIVEMRSPGNDNWGGAKGDSLRDLVDHLAHGVDPQLDDMQPTFEDAFEDPQLRQGVRDLLLELYDDDVLLDVPESFAYLSNVDNAGGSLQSGEVSAIEAFVRMLSEANEPMTCSVQIGFGTLDINLPNLGTTILSVLADQDPYDVQDLTGILSDVLDFGLSQWVLDLIVDSDACNVLDQDMLDDMRVLEVLQEPEAEPALVMLIGMFRTWKNAGSSDQLDDFADMARALHRSQSMAALTEVLRDIGEEPGARDLMQLVDIFGRPAAHGISVPTSGRPLRLIDGINRIYWLVDSRGGQTGWQEIEPLVAPVIEQEGTWVAVGNLGIVMSRPDSQLSRGLDLVPPLVDADPELTLLDELAPLLSDKQL